jgi:hypothetical protein
MSDEVRVNESEGIIEVVSSGDLTRQEMGGTMATLQRILDEKGIRRVLIDTTRLHSAPGTLDIFELCSTYSRVLKIALLVTDSNGINKDVAFAETVGVNRGQTVKMFWDEEEARRWLGTANDQVSNHSVKGDDKIAAAPYADR